MNSYLCTGKSAWIKQQLQDERRPHSIIVLNETTRDSELIFQLRGGNGWRSPQGALVLCPSPLARPLRVDMLVLRLLVLKQLAEEDGKPFVLGQRRLYVEVPNVLEKSQSLLEGLGFYELLGRHEAEMGLNFNSASLQKACGYLRACHHGITGSMTGVYLDPMECRRLLEHYGPSTRNGTLASPVPASGLAGWSGCFFPKETLNLDYTSMLLRSKTQMMTRKALGMVESIYSKML